MKQQDAPPTNLPARYLEALRGEDPLVIQARAPRRLKRLLAGLRDAQLRKQPARGKWSIHEVIAHLADHEVVYGFRLRCVAALDRPALAGYDQQRFLDGLQAGKASTQDLFAAYAAARKANHALVLRLPPEAFERIGLHAERGAETLRTIVTRNAGHDVLHERQIERARAAVLRGSKRRRK